jgi:hypothetical protein
LFDHSIAGGLEKLEELHAGEAGRLEDLLEGLESEYVLVLGEEEGVSVVADDCEALKLRKFDKRVVGGDEKSRKTHLEFLLALQYPQLSEDSLNFLSLKA